MDNQQERLDAARIAMFLDTDGWISMRVVQRGKHRIANVRPEMGMVNTSHELIAWASEALRRMNVAFYIQEFRLSKYSYGKNCKDQQRICIVGLKRMRTILPQVIPYLVAKRRQAELLVEFIESRLAAEHKAAYSDRECEIANTVRGLNSNKGGAFRPISSETSCAAHELRTMLRGKVKSDLTRNRESVAEMTTQPVLT